MSQSTTRIRLMAAAAAMSLGLVAACTGTASTPANVPSAPTQQAVATGVATSVAPVAATVTAASPVRVTGAQLASNDAKITLQNTSTQAVDLAGWSLRVGNATAQLPQGTNVGPSQSVTLHTAAGTSTAADVFLGQNAQALVSQIQPGAMVALDNPSGGTVSSFVVPSGSG
ncbi:MAG: lamin tail domain-containing protein [Chloroflexi bacterium]|nr:lamin tail domain-containing protein [Chloroflexota bacterium]